MSPEWQRSITSGTNAERLVPECSSGQRAQDCRDVRHARVVVAGYMVGRATSRASANGDDVSAARSAGREAHLVPAPSYRSRG